jgi:hypothetical protein
MGREVHRVPLDFNWPMHKKWEGYVNPYYDKMMPCAACGGTGYNKVGKFLSDSWYRHMAQEMFGAFFGDNILSAWSRPQLERAGWSSSVCDNIEMAQRFEFTTLTHWSDKLVQEEIDTLVEEGRLHDLTSTWSAEDGWQRKEDIPNPTPDEVAVWGSRGFGHDAINQHICVEARAKRFGITDLTCKECNGSGEYWSNPEDKVAAEAWERSDPPEGEGWQMWETTSEGSPVSPVFAAPEELARWLADTEASTFGSMTADYETWLKMIKGSGWAMSMASSSETGLVSGVEAVAELTEDE